VHSHFGLSAESERVYRILLDRPRARVDELARALGWDKEKTAAQVAKLSDLGLVRPSREQSGALRALEPEAELRVPLARECPESAGVRDQADVAQAALIRWPSSVHQVTELFGLGSIRRQLEQLAHRTRREVLAFVPGGLQQRDSIAASKTPNHHVLSRGVRMRSVYLDSARRDKATSAHLRWLCTRGAEVRTVPMLPMRMIVFDREHVMLPSSSGGASGKAVLLSGSGVASTITELFHHFWRDATPFKVEEDTGGDEPELPDEWKALLRLLREGCTEEQAGRRLGVSTRTVGRITAELMAQLGARSRFEAGVLATLKGWVDQ
jgi:DNA-binding CsgD family transcriptional regulator